jgi:uncharacterized membrane protein (TIGR02234 family)
VLVCVALVAAAGALEGASRLGWFTAAVEAVGRGAVPVTATGADLLPGLSGVALLALAAVAAAVALAGIPRRVVGGLVAAAGGYVGVAAVRLVLSPPLPADLAVLPDAPAGGTAVAGSVVLQPGPLPTVLGGVLLLAAGLGLIVAEPRLPRFGARYAARAAERAGGGGPGADPDRAAWEALDAGRDPTADPGPAHEQHGPGTDRDPPATDVTAPVFRGRTDAGPPGDPV